ncbi:MAG: lipopolysaccharide kinase InaA family protein [Gammaproteobacteria bacterium]|nr:lipopolysaccharide kinase InaA family protein [Gammaproteobacteria bacterium]
MILISDAKQLISDIRVPFSVALGDQMLLCEEVLRMLPNKRIVVKGTWKGEAIVGKIYFGAHHTKRHFQKTLRGTRLLEKHRIQTPKIVYAGIVNHLYIILFKYLPATIDADDLFFSTLAKPFIQQLALQHAKGLLHSDLHPHNYLATQEGLFVLDSQEVRQKGMPLPMADCLKNLGELLAQLSPTADDKLEKLLDVYLQGRKDLNTYDKKADWVRQLEHWQYLSRLKREKEKLKKIFRNATLFRAGKNKHFHYVCRKEYVSPEFISFLNAPDFWMDKGECLKDGNTCTVSKVSIDGRLFVVKRYNIKNWLHRLSRFFRGSRAAQYWKNAHRLELYRMPLPKPVALIEKRYGIFRGKAYYVSEFVPGDLLNSYLENESSLEKKQNVLQQVKTILDCLYRLKLTHGDMKASNFIVHDQKVFMIDLDSVKRVTGQRCLLRALEKDKRRFLMNLKDPTLQEHFYSLSKYL